MEKLLSTCYVKYLESAGCHLLSVLINQVCTILSSMAIHILRQVAKIY